jgi:cell division transport system permease protein
MGRLLYFFKEAVRGFHQAKLMTSVSIVAIAVSLTIIYALILGALNLRVLFATMLHQVDVVAYLDETTAQDSLAIPQLQATVAKFPHVDSVGVTTKQQAWMRFEQLYGNEMLASVDSNPLPASLDIRVQSRFKTRQDIESLGNELQQLKGVESVDFSPEWFERISAFRRYLMLGALVAALACVLVLYFIVSNTVKLTIYARKDLVTNMRFVGATNGYIAAPFIIEGIMQGLMGAAAAVGCGALMRYGVGLHLLSWGPPSLPWLMLGTGVVFGWLGSRSAVRRFLV